MTDTKNILTSTLSRLKVKYTDSYANKLFNEHPHKYNLYGISSMLSTYKVSNIGIKVEDKRNNIDKLETPFIAHIGHDFVVVFRINGNNVHYQWEDKIIKINKDDFINIWSGVALLLEAKENSIEPNYLNHKRFIWIKNLKSTICAIAVLILFSLFIFINDIYNNIGILFVVLLNAIGVCISYILVQKQVSTSGNYADKICSLFKKSDCNNILESKAAKFFGIIGWSEIGLGFFLINTITLIINPTLIYTFAIFNIISLPYTVWSILYQKFWAKQWCPLCLLVQLIFLLIFFIDISQNFINYNFISFEQFIIYLCLYILSILGINMLIPHFSTNEKLERTTQEMNALKMKNGVFEACLKNQPYYKVDNNNSKILFGNIESDFIVTILTNPHCSPCADMHKRVEVLLKSNLKKVCLQYIFSSFNKELDYTGKFLTAIYLQKGKEEALRIYDEWYSNGKFDKKEFFSKYDSIHIDNEVEEEYQKHQLWRKDNGISSTPTILINGYLLPDIYKIEEIGEFIELHIQ